MTGPTTANPDPGTPDGPAPHAPPLVADICLNMVGLEGTPGSHGAVDLYSNDLASALWAMTLAPYIAMWSIFSGLPDGKPDEPR